MTNSELATARWAVALEGDPFDIEDARDLFAKHDEVQVRIIEVAPDRNPTVLLAKEFENLSSSSEVSEASRRIFDLLNGIMFVRDRVRKPVQPGAVYERREDGRWSAGTIFAKLAAFEDRDRFYAAAVILQAPGSPPPSPAPPPPHMVWLTEATRDDTLADVLTFLRGEPDWFDLYKAFELMRDDINSKLGQNKYEQMGWPDKKTVDVFSESAQVYRHSRAKWPEGYDLITAMKSDEAREFIQSLALAWLGWRYPAKT
jgi:hypothetical protein